MTKKKILSMTILFIIGLGILGLSHQLKKSLSQRQSDLQGGSQAYSLDQVNSLDASMARPYSKKLDDMGTLFVILGNFFTCIVCFAGPGLAALRQLKKDRKGAMAKIGQVFMDFFIFIQVWIYTRGIYSILKTCVGRIRPYMYFPNPSQSGIEEGDFCRSWPSGHSASVFLATGFLIIWAIFNRLSPAVKKIACIVSLIISLETVLLRVLSGNHFFTDVVTGSLLGLVISMAIFLINKKIAGLSTKSE